MSMMRRETVIPMRSCYCKAAALQYARHKRDPSSSSAQRPQCSRLVSRLLLSVISLLPMRELLLPLTSRTPGHSGLADDAVPQERLQHLGVGALHIELITLEDQLDLNECRMRSVQQDSDLALRSKGFRFP